MSRREKYGFTLIELMIVVAIIGILAAIAIPKFAALIRKSAEANGKGNLASLRSALTVYYGTMEGQYPNTLSALTMNSTFMASMPVSKTPNYHLDNSTEFDITGVATNDGGNWIFNNVTTDPNVGQLNINCTHTDTKGTVWSAY